VVADGNYIKGTLKNRVRMYWVDASESR